MLERVRLELGLWLWLNLDLGLAASLLGLCFHLTGVQDRRIGQFRLPATLLGAFLWFHGCWLFQILRLHGNPDFIVGLFWKHLLADIRVLHFQLLIRLN